MAGRPPNGPPSHNTNLIDFDEYDQQPTYYSGARPPVHDHELLDRYDIDSSDAAPQGRPSVSYDEFVGASRPQPQGLPGGPGAPSTGPQYLQRENRGYSQTSGVSGYSRYSDAEIPADDDHSTQGYYAAGGTFEQGSPGMQHSSRNAAHNRNSILSLGGGLTGRVKNMFGRGQDYSEMDLPLTENAAQQGHAAPSAYQDPSESPKKKTKSTGAFKFGFGRGSLRS